jgi:hypothetical protein
MKSLGIAVAAASLLLASTLAMAANETGGFPDVRGQWKTSVDHVVTGSGPHYRKDANPGQARNEKTDVTLTIDRQEGRKFWGNFSANGEVTPMLGVIASDKKTMYRVDATGGHAIATLVGRDKLDGCYFRGGQDLMVAGCHIMTRQR